MKKKNKRIVSKFIDVELGEVKLYDDGTVDTGTEKRIKRILKNNSEVGKQKRSTRLFRKR